MQSGSSPVLAIVVVAFLAALVTGIYSIVVKMIRSENKNAIRLFEEMKTWPTVDGIIVGSSIKKESVRYRNSQLGQSVNDVKTVYSPDVRYKFTVDGKEFDGGRVTLVEDVSFYEDSPLLKHVLGSYRVGQKVRVFYNPENPVDCLLNQNSNMTKFREKAEFGLYTMIKGAMLNPTMVIALRVMFIVPLVIISLIIIAVVRGYLSSGVYSGNGWVPVCLFFALLTVPPLLMKKVARREGVRLEEYAKVAQHWPTAIGEISYISSDDNRASALVGETDLRSTADIPAVLYTFTVNDEVFTGNQVVFAQSFWKPENDKVAENKWSGLKRKESVSICYNKNDPFDSVLDPRSISGINYLKKFTLVGIF